MCRGHQPRIVGGKGNVVHVEGVADERAEDRAARLHAVTQQNGVVVARRGKHGACVQSLIIK